MGALPPSLSPCVCPTPAHASSRYLERRMRALPTGHLRRRIQLVAHVEHRQVHRLSVGHLHGSARRDGVHPVRRGQVREHDGVDELHGLPARHLLRWKGRVRVHGVRGGHVLRWLWYRQLHALQCWNLPEQHWRHRLQELHYRHAHGRRGRRGVPELWRGPGEMPAPPVARFPLFVCR